MQEKINLEEINENLLITSFLNYQLLEKTYWEEYSPSSGEIDWIKTTSPVVCDSKGSMLVDERNNPYETFYDIQFKSFDKLFEIIHHIESLKFPLLKNYSYVSFRRSKMQSEYYYVIDGCLDWGSGTTKIENFVIEKSTTEIDSLYAAIVSFIKWFNLIKK